ncbi:MAG: hypothetical protein ABI841_01865 [Chloroflexota bacterium]
MPPMTDGLGSVRQPPQHPALGARPHQGRGLDERAVLRIGLLLTAAFVAAALVAFALPGAGRGHWAGVHFALAGAAMVAVGTFMPHFGATLAGSRPESAPLRLGGVGALASGAVLVVSGIVSQATAIAFAGAGLLWFGVAITAWTTLRPGTRSLARRHPVARAAYGVALLEVAVGIGLPLLLLLGWEPAVSSWVRLKTAHVWLNLFGFISLTISATLVYLYPTVLGARIRAHATLAAMIGGGIVGPALVAIAAILGSYLIAVAGGLLAVVGALGQVGYGLDVYRRRGRWTTDHGWHRVTIGHLSAGMAWYLLAAATAAVGLLRDGPAPSGWGLGALGIPLIAGWALQVLVGAWTHLLPAVGSVEPVARARQRRLLGRLAVPRLVLWNAGVLVAWLGLGLGSLPVALAGTAAFSLVVASSVGLALSALLPERRRETRAAGH